MCKFPKVISLLCIFSLLASTISCGSAESPDAVTDGGSSDETTAGSTTAVVNRESSGLPRKDFDGAEFVFLSPNVSNMAHTWYLLSPDELTGDALNDAMFNRNRKIEDIYNINISTTYSSAVKNDSRNAVNAGENSYTVVFGSMNEMYANAQEGIFANWYTLPYIDLDASWWDASVIRDLTYHNKLYMCTGDISPATNTRVYSLVFNKDLCRELGLEMPYQAVLDGAWTLDLFNKYISDVNADVNGDSKMDYSDRWGYFSQDGNSFMMYFSGGGRVVEPEKNGDLKLTFNSERNIRLAVEALNISIDETKTLMANQYVSDNGGNWSVASAWFASGGSLMRSSVFEPVPRDYRAMTTDFGVLPYPKLDENQEKYYTLGEEFSKMLCVPVTSDLELAGLILESLAAESVSTVTPAYYDVCLNGKSVRDEESKAMLDIIFANKVFDIGLIANVGNFKSMLTNLEKSDSTDVASAYAAALDSAQATLEKICESFDRLE